MALSTLRSFLMLAAGDACGAMWCDLTKGNAALADVSYPDKPHRQVDPLPASVNSRSEFMRKCVGCFKCLQACPRHVLKISDSAGHFMRPAMDFSHGWCYPECSLCAKACPTGALGVPLVTEEKKSRKVGVAVWNRTKCLRMCRKEKCNACERHCPANAITHGTDGSVIINAKQCIGCGSCENHCPARPLTAIHVEGLK